MDDMHLKMRCAEIADGNLDNAKNLYAWFTANAVQTPNAAPTVPPGPAPDNKLAETPLNPKPPKAEPKKPTAKDYADAVKEPEKPAEDAKPLTYNDVRNEFLAYSKKVQDAKGDTHAAGLAFLAELGDYPHLNKVPESEWPKVIARLKELTANA